MISVLLPNTRCSFESFAIYTSPATIPAGAMNTDNRVINTRAVPVSIFLSRSWQRGHDSASSGSGLEQFSQYRIKIKIHFVQSIPQYLFHVILINVN